MGKTEASAVSSTDELPSPENCNLADAKRAKDSIAAALKAMEPKPLTIGPEKNVTLENGKSFAFASTSEAGGPELQKALNLIQSKSFNQAIDALKAVQQKFPNTPNSAAASYNLAGLYRYLGLGENVLSLANAALQEDPPEPYRSALMYQKALSLKEKSDFVGALTALDSIATDKELGPSSGQKLALASEISTAYKPGKEAPALLQQAIQQESDPVKKAERQLELASIYLKQNDRSEASQVYKSMLDSCGASTLSHCRTAVYALADMSYQNKNWPMAIEYYQRALSKFSDKEHSPWARYQLGNVFRQQKRFGDAVKAFDQLIKEYPGTYWADQAKWSRDDVVWQEKNQKILGGK
jgi:tetratricopeptide (TPR) repeat protein